MGLLIFHLIDPSWPKGGQEVLCILECTEAWEQNVLLAMLGRTGFQVAVHDRRGLDGVKKAVPSPLTSPGAPVGQVSLHITCSTGVQPSGL